VLSTTAHAAAGATGTRLSLRPLIKVGRTSEQNSREMRGENANLCLFAL
jgi:hypothetical protein